MKYSVFAVLVSMCLGGCVAQTTSDPGEAAETGEAQQGLGEALGQGGLVSQAPGSTKATPSKNEKAPLNITFIPAAPAAPDFAPGSNVMGNPPPQPWTEPGRGPESR